MAGLNNTIKGRIRVVLGREGRLGHHTRCGRIHLSRCCNLLPSQMDIFRKRVASFPFAVWCAAIRWRNFLIRQTFTSFVSIYVCKQSPRKRKHLYRKYLFRPQYNLATSTAAISTESPIEEGNSIITRKDNQKFHDKLLPN